jgi:hypothetical protein
MYCKIIEEVCRKLENPWMIYSLKKNGGKTKWEGGKVCKNPRVEYGFLKGLWRTPAEY